MQNVRFRNTITLTAIGCMAIVAPALAEEPAPSFELDVLPFVAMYCADCHNADDLRGDLDLERFQTTDMVLDSLAVWQRAAMRIENKEMPPKRERQPSDEERGKLLAWVKSLEFNDEDCNRIANEESVSWYPGYVMSRRLNRFEYENTVRDLLGVPIDVAEMFPADGSGGEGFDNDGSALFLSAIQLEKYLEAADLAIETALPDTMREPRTTALRSREARPNRPLTETERMADAARRRLITQTPRRGVTPRDAAADALADFATQAWRRPVSEDEVHGLLKMFDRGYERGDGYEASLKLGFKAALVSPNFLFLAEPEPGEPGVYELDDYPLASRLSYFLWGTMPDEALLEVAREGNLSYTDELERQVARMMRDPKSAALGELFAAQWLGITQLGETLKPDAERFPEFDDALADMMRAEAAHVFNRIVREDRSLLELIDADYTYANERLAAIYQLDGVQGNDMRLVQLADETRGGVLGMAAVLAATSHPLRTSPVLRGKWVLEQLLGDRVPPPPPDAGVLPEDDVQPDGLTLRARLEAHRERAECASCHARMDPIGFGLENYDPIGRWRDQQAGQPVDAKGVLPSGEAFEGPAELKAILLARKDEFARNLSRKMLGYALGRSLTRYDACVVEDCVAALRENDYRASALITEIVLSYPFRHRYSGIAE